VKSTKTAISSNTGPGKDLEKIMMTRTAKKFDRKEILVRPQTSKPEQSSSLLRRASTNKLSDNFYEDLSNHNF
jgi:hypothetical protein